jgi:hypothetical protein
MSNRRLTDLESQVRRDLKLTEHPALVWMPATTGPSGVHVYDVVIAGGGGVALAMR